MMARAWLVLLVSVLVGLTYEDNLDWILYVRDENKLECFLSIYRYYCHAILVKQLPMNETDKNSCNGGRLLSFRQLKARKTTTNTLIQWLVPFHLVERYAAYI